MNTSVVNFTSSLLFTNFTESKFWTIGIQEMCILAFSFLFGLLIHTYVLYLIWQSGIASDFLSFNLSICEIFFSLNSLLFLLRKCFQSLIPLTEFLIGMGITGRPLFQCLICFERYLAVVHPVIFLKYKPLRYRVICSVISWLICLVSCLSCFILLISFNYFGYTIFYLLQFLLYFSGKLFCLLSVLRVLKKSGPGERGREREEENQMKKRAFHIILITTVGMSVMYIPFATTGLFTLVTVHSIQSLWTFGFLFFMLAGFVQPIIFLRRTKII